MADLKLAADIGGSQTKAWCGERMQMVVFRQPPQVADLPPTKLALIEANTRTMGGDGNGRLPIQYIQLTENGPAYVLGMDAQDSPNKNAKALPKRLLAVYKVLDLLGQVWERFVADNNNFSLDLAVLLPFSEYHADHTGLAKELAAAAECFWYRGVKLSVKLETVKVVPEGAGLVLWRMLELKKLSQSLNQTFVVLMMGHRNLSFLLFLNGNPPTGEPSESSPYGFSTLIRTAASGLPVRGNPEEDPFILDSILAGTPEVVFPDRSNQVFPLKLQEARDYYWSVVKNFLDEKLAAVRMASRYEVIISGGAALHFRQEINAYFAERQRFCHLSWALEAQEELKYYLPLIVKTEADSVRLGDVYGLYKWLTILTRTNQGAVNVSSSVA